MTSIIALDPGKITGVAVGMYTDTEPVQIRTARVITYAQLTQPYFWENLNSRYDVIVSEKFILADNKFQADLTPVRIEGMMDLMLPGKVAYRTRNLKSQVPDDILKEHGLWAVGKDVDWEDGRDANDAVIHLLGHVAFGLKHVPTLRKYFR